MVRRMLLVLVLMLVAAPVRAYTGGPDVFEPLGWSASEQRVYWLVHGWNESGSPPRIYFAALRMDSSRYGVRQLQVPAPRQEATIASLRRRLKPLVEHVSARVPRITGVVSDTTGRNDWGNRYPRYHVRGFFNRSGLEFEVVTFCRPEVFLLHDYRIPGHDEHLAVLGFIGMPDNCEETQEAVLVKPGQPIPRLEYQRRW